MCILSLFRDIFKYIYILKCIIREKSDKIWLFAYLIVPLQRND